MTVPAGRRVGYLPLWHSEAVKMNEMRFTPQPTPNPNSYKFVASRALQQGPTLSFYSPQAAAAHPLAAELFAVAGVTGVMILNDFCSVNQDGSRSWTDLIPEIQAILGRHFKAG